MATATLTDMKNRFPAGTSVGAYAVSAFPGGWSGGALPSGLTAAATATVASNGSLTFTGLTAATEYRAYAVVNSSPVWVAFFVDAAASTVGAILPWASGTRYTAGQAVTSGGNTYTANDAHTAGATFAGDKTAHWTALPVSAGGGAAVPITLFKLDDLFASFRTNWRCPLEDHPEGYTNDPLCWSDGKVVHAQGDLIHVGDITSDTETSIGDWAADWVPAVFENLGAGAFAIPYGNTYIQQMKWNLTTLGISWVWFDIAKQAAGDPIVAGGDGLCYISVSFNFLLNSALDPG